MEHRLFSLSAKVLIRNNDGRYLLLKRSQKSRSNPGKWEFPGGKVDRGEILEPALLREVSEETGLAIALDHVAGAAESEFYEWRVAHMIMEAHLESGEVCLSDEHSDFTWVPLDELPKMDMPEHFRSFAEEYVKRQRA
jgi:8-oxo-dGTP diphosphatase